MAERAAIESMCGVPKSIKKNLDRYALDKEYSMSPPTADDTFFAIQVPWRQHRSKHCVEEQPILTAPKETKTLPTSASEGCLVKSPSLDNLNAAVSQFFCKDNRTSLPSTPFSTPPSTPHGTPHSSPMIQRREFKHKEDPSKHPFKRFYFPTFQQAARLHSVSETEGSESSKNSLNMVTDDGLQVQRLRQAPTGSLLGDACFSKESSPELPLSPGSQESVNLSDTVVGRPRLGSGGSPTPRGYYYMGMGNLNESVKELVDKKLEMIKPDNPAPTQMSVKPPTPPKTMKEPVFEPPKRPARMIPKNSKLRELNMFAPGAGF